MYVWSYKPKEQLNSPSIASRTEYIDLNKENYDDVNDGTFGPGDWGLFSSLLPLLSFEAVESGYLRNVHFAMLSVCLCQCVFSPLSCRDNFLTNSVHHVGSSLGLAKIHLDTVVHRHGRPPLLSALSQSIGLPVLFLHIR